MTHRISRLFGLCLAGGIWLMASCSSGRNADVPSSTNPDAGGASGTSGIGGIPNTGGVGGTGASGGFPATGGTSGGGSGATGGTGTGGNTKDGSAAHGGTDYFVSTAGSNRNGNGTKSNPWATIAFASTRIGPGDTVHVAAGVYTGSFSTSASGSSSAPVTYEADTADFSAAVNCARVAADHGNLSTCAQLLPGSSSTWANSGDYVVIKGFDVTGPNACCGAITSSGIATQFLDNDVHNTQNSNGCPSMGGEGIGVDGPDEIVDGNYVHDNGPSGACGYIHGIYVSEDTGTASGAVVENNISFNNSGWGIQLWHSARNEILVNNTIFNNRTGGIVVGASSTTDTGTVVNNNIVFNNPGTDGGICEEGNTGTNTYTDNLVYQNTPTNLCLQNGDTATGTVSANPQFINYTGDTTGDYHLQSTSPAINAGTTQDAPATDFDGNTRPQGSGYDVGAYE